MSYQYVVSFGSSASGPFQQYNVVPVTTDTVTGLSSNTPYFFQIVTLDTVTGVQSSPVVVGPFTTSSATTESIAGTTVTVNTQTIRSGTTPGVAPPAAGPFDTWTITAAGGQVVHNGNPDPNTGNIILLYYTNHFVYQQANATNGLGLNPGWWQWTGGTTGNGFGWTDSQDPRPTVPTITMATVQSTPLNTPFGISGLLQVYTAVPTLQYADNAGTVQAFPAGSTVTTTSWSFTHPGISATNLNFTVKVQDTAGHSVTSNTFSAANPTITDITISGNTFTANSAGATVGTLSAVMQGGTFGGTFSVAGSQFSITGGNILTASSLAAGSYTANVTATQTGISGSPFNKSLSLTAQSGPAVGPGVTGSFVTADFTANSGQTVSKFVWGVADGGDIGGNGGNGSGPGGTGFTGKNGNGGLTNTSIQNILRTCAFTLYRFNSQCGYTERLFCDFSGNNPTNCNTTLRVSMDNQFGALINNFPSIAPGARLVIGIGFHPNLWASASAFANVCSQIATYFNSHPSCPVYGFEIGNEDDNGSGNIPSFYVSYFNAASQAIKAVNSNYKIFGPVFSFDGSLQSFASQCGANCDHLDYHAYAYGPGDDLTTRRSQAAILNYTILNNLGNDFTAWRNGGGSANAEILIGEYNQNNTFGTGGQNVFMQNGTGAVFTAKSIVSGLNATNQFTMGGIWSVFQDSDYGQIGGSDNVNAGTFQPCPSGWMLSKAGQTMFGTRSNVTVSAGVGGTLMTLAVKGGPASNAFALMIINASTTSSASGQVALSHWPVNTTGTGTINRFEVGNNNPNGNVTTLSVTAGLVAATTIPPVSVVILYSP
jgi:hypothetical protein